MRECERGRGLMKQLVALDPPELSSELANLLRKGGDAVRRLIRTIDLADRRGHSVGVPRGHSVQGHVVHPLGGADLLRGGALSVLDRGIRS